MAAADEQHYFLVSDLIAAAEVVPFLGAGANLCDRPDETAVGAGRVRSERGRARPALADRSRYRRPQFGSAPRLAVRRRDPRRAAAVPLPAMRSSIRTTRRRRFIACSRVCRPVLRERGVAAAARSDDELRRPRRACVGGSGRVVRRGLVRGQARPAAGPVRAPAAGGRGDPDRAAEQVHRPRPRGAKP